MSTDDRQVTTMPADDQRRGDDAERVSRLVALAEGLGAGGSDGWAGIQSVVRELEELEPGTTERLRRRLAQRRIARGLASFAGR